MDVVNSPDPDNLARIRRKAPIDRRADLRAVAIACLARLGPRAATGREICRQAGVSHGLLRHYFETPEKLLLESYRELCDRFLAGFATELEDDDPWAALDRFFALLFSEEWAGAEVLGAWTGFWTLVRSHDGFAAVYADYNRRLRALLDAAVARLPAAPRLARADASAIMSSTMDGLWLDACLSSDPAARERAVALCRAAARTIFAG